MTHEHIVRSLLFCAVGNAALLLVWFGALVFAREAVYRMHSRWFKLSREQFEAIHYALMAAYKMLVLFFNVMPLLALWALD